MNHTNFEIKARYNDLDFVRAFLRKQNARYVGLDHQIDTYFKVRKGRLKLRQGNIENNLIYYERENIAGAKQSNVILVRTEPDSKIEQILLKLFDVLVVVDKKREIYFIDNVKFHIDEVKGLGSFIEIEAIDEDGTLGIDKIREQCNYYIGKLNIRQFIDRSYSDMLIG
jgi:predicted adenylyl cyclase CyaB